MQSPYLKSGNLCSTTFFFLPNSNPCQSLPHQSHSRVAVHPGYGARFLCSTSLGVHYLHKVNRILNRRIAYSCPFIYLCNNLFISVWTHECLCYTLGYSPILLYFVAHTILSFAIRRSFRWFFCLLDILIIMGVFLTFWHYIFYIT